MKKILAACLAAVTMILMTSCGGESFKPHVMTEADVGAVRVSDGEAITYGMKRIDVEKILGKSDANSMDTNSTSYDEGKISIFYRLTDESGHKLTTDRQTVAGVLLTPDAAGYYKTPRGFEPGQSAEEALAAYGEYPGTQSNLTLTYQYDVARKKMITPQQNNPDRDTGLLDQFIVQFTLDGGNVISISMMDRRMALQQS